MFIFISSKFIVILFLPTKIDVISCAFPSAHILRVRIFSTWEEVQPVHRLQHDSIIVVENGLSSITLVNIPIEDKDFVPTIGCKLCSQRDVVEEAEAMVVCGMCVMTWRSGDAEASLLWTFLIEHLADC